MRFLVLTVALLVASAFSAETAPGDSTAARDPGAAPANDSAIVAPAFDGVPWNRTFFPRERLLKRSTIDPALGVAFSYSVNFIGGTYGTFAQHSYLAHLAYEFMPNLHLYADLGLWMPLYARPSADAPIPKEDVRMGKVDLVIPAVALEYKPTDNSAIRLLLVNESDAFKAYGPFLHSSCYWRNSIFCR